MVSFTAHFRPYLLGHRFTLWTDHAPLTWLYGVKEPKGTIAGVGLQDHPPATSETSECGCSFQVAVQAMWPHTGEDDKNNESATIATLQLSSYVSANINDKQMEDQELQFIITAKQSNERIAPAQEAAQSLELHRLLQIWDQLTISNGVLYRLFLGTAQPSGICYQLVVPRCMRDNVLKEVHEGAMGGHLGEEKTLQKLKEWFYWPGHLQSESGVPPAVDVKCQHLTTEHLSNMLPWGHLCKWWLSISWGHSQQHHLEINMFCWQGTTLPSEWRHTQYPIRKQ